MAPAEGRQRRQKGGEAASPRENGEAAPAGEDREVAMALAREEGGGYGAALLSVSTFSTAAVAAAKGMGRANPSTKHEEAEGGFAERFSHGAMSAPSGTPPLPSEASPPIDPFGATDQAASARRRGRESPRIRSPVRQPTWGAHEILRFTDASVRKEDHGEPLQ